MDSIENLEKRSLQINNNINKSRPSSNASNSSQNNKKTSYGSLKRETANLVVNHRHKLNRTETIQGLSLKYGVPIENIKRANRLWSNDLSFIKDYLIIPIPKETLTTLDLNDSDLNGEHMSTSGILELNQINASMVSSSSSSSNNDLRLKQSHSNESKSTSSKENLLVATNVSSESNNNFNDYLNKYDQLISDSKKKLKCLENAKSLSLSIDHPEDFITRHLKSTSILEKNNEHILNNEDLSTSSETDDILSITPESVRIKSKTSIGSASSRKSTSSQSLNNSNRSKQAHETLKKLEREKDDLYEL